MPIEIKRTGEIQPLDKDGYIINTSSLEKIVSPWKEAVDDLVQVYVEKFGDALMGVYLRGSVPRGRAVAGVSDLDTIVLVKPEYSDNVDLSWFKEFVKDFEKRHPYVNEIELRWVNHQSLFDPKKLRNVKIQLAIYGLCIWGEDVVSQLPKLKPGRDTVIHAFTIAEQVMEAIADIQIRETSDGVESKCAWIMKAFLRTGCELTMEREGAYTRDLYPCYELFAKYYPEQSGDMYRVLDLALNPIDDKESLIPFVHDFGAWLVSECMQQGLVEPNR